MLPPFKNLNQVFPLVLPSSESGLVEDRVLTLCHPLERENYFLT
jgi:hypothetical protein